ncbi:MAG: glycosyl hydrolase, partial [bacterium]|nr:glycosyl hydrolase [bacterium]
DHGIRNLDWFTTLGADGQDQAVEPGNPNIHYGEFQQGYMFRTDRITGEAVYIQPQAREGEPFERFNWDAPIEVSFHQPTRILTGSYRVWRSDDRGDSWTPISGDLTRSQERVELPIMGRVQSWDAAWDVGAMSVYNTVTSIGESPLDENLIYAGTDDGLLSVTEDGGENWRRIEAGEMANVPNLAFVNDVKVSHHDPNTVFVALDNHKNGDFSPYLVKSTDRGQSWTSIAGDIPDRHLVWRVVQDHVNPDLLFAATEFGVFFTVNGGDTWTELPGAPTISFRDIVIHREREDLVAASFGRGIFVLDDYTPLREGADGLAGEAELFDTRPALWYQPKDVQYGQGADQWTADNPPFGAVFTYWLRDSYQSLEDERKAREKEIAEGQDVPFPGWSALE